MMLTTFPTRQVHLNLGGFTAFVSNWCHFFGTSLPIPWRHIQSLMDADQTVRKVPSRDGAISGSSIFRVVWWTCLCGVCFYGHAVDAAWRSRFGMVHGAGRGVPQSSRAPVSDSDSCHSRCPSSVLLPFFDDSTMPGKPRNCRKPLGPMNVPPGMSWVAANKVGRMP